MKSRSTLSLNKKHPENVSAENRLIFFCLVINFCIYIEDFLDMLIIAMLIINFYKKKLKKMLKISPIHRKSILIPLIMLIYRKQRVEHNSNNFEAHKIGGPTGMTAIIISNIPRLG